MLRVLLAGLVGFGGVAFGEPREVLFVHNTDSGEISMVAVPEHEVIGEIEVGKYMDFVTPSPDEKTLYVNRIDTLGVPIASNIGETGELIAIDPSTRQVQWRLALDGMPHHMIASKDGKYVFVPFYDTWWLAVVDVERRAVAKKIFIGHGGHGTKLSPDGKLLYVGSMMYDTLSIIDTDRLEMIDRIPFRDGVRPFCMTSDGKRMYVQLSRFHGFVIVDLERREEIGEVAMPALPEGVEIPAFYPHNVNHGIALTRDESMLFANGSIVDYVAVYSHPELELITTIPVGTDPNSIAFSKDGRFAYVTNRGSHDLSVISVADLEEVKRIPLGRKPQRMAVMNVEMAE